MGERMRHRRVIGIVLMALAVHGVATELPAAAARSTSALPGPRTAAPCGTSNGNQPKITHVIWIWMENESYGSIIGSADAPYESALARECGLAENYQAITHPSLPNYLAATGGSTFGVADDGEPRVHPINSPSLFSQVAAAHETWRSYAESMPEACDLITSGEYAARHNPAVYYVPVRVNCESDDVPMGSISTGAFAVAARSGHLPNFSFVIPNICDDAHSCPVRHGDTWLASFLSTVFASPQYRQGTVVVFLTFDEGNLDNHVPTIVAARSVPTGAVSVAMFNHYSMLRTTEQLLGLPLLGAAAHASSMTAAFGL